MFKFISTSCKYTYNILFVGAGKGSNSDLDCLIFFDILRKEWLEAAVPKRKMQNALNIYMQLCNFAYPSVNCYSFNKLNERMRIIGNFYEMKKNNDYLLFELIGEKMFLFLYNFFVFPFFIEILFNTNSYTTKY